MNKDIDQSIFEDMPVPKALAAMALPTILSQLITTVYNLADAFFIGKTNDPYKVAALSLAFVLHLFLTAIANLFGIGGGSLISRLLGKFEKESARHICAFSVYGALLLSLRIFLREVLLWNRYSAFRVWEGFSYRPFQPGTIRLFRPLLLM